MFRLLKNLLPKNKIILLVFFTDLLPKSRDSISNGVGEFIVTTFGDCSHITHLQDIT